MTSRYYILVLLFLFSLADLSAETITNNSYYSEFDEPIVITPSGGYLIPELKKQTNDNGAESWLLERNNKKLPAKIIIFDRLLNLTTRKVHCEIV